MIAGYHWFTDWGRDTMISLEGLTLVTRRYVEAGYILRTFAHYIRDGLIPNLFPEGEKNGLYHTADATLWFFHALDRYLAATDDRETLRLLLPKLLEVIEHHLRGTRFGIGADPADGLLRQGAPGYQLTWMDAKVGDWVVTPRRGKAVEINALWYNALRLLEGWVRSQQGDAAARPLADRAEQVRQSFNRRFWYAEGGHLYDVVDGDQGDDPACRPNQVFAISLPHPVSVPLFALIRVFFPLQELLAKSRSTLDRFCIRRRIGTLGFSSGSLGISLSMRRLRTPALCANLCAILLRFGMHDESKKNSCPSPRFSILRRQKIRAKNYPH